MKYLFCIGAQKAGTTFLYQLLVQHEGISFSEYKETRFFTSMRLFKKGKDWLIRQFPVNEKTQYLADFTPEYLPDPLATERILNDFGDDARIVILLRDPVKRAFSHYKMEITSGRERRTFKEVVEAETTGEYNPLSIVGRGLYYPQVKRVLSLFKRENVLILDFMDLTGKTEESILKIFAFLDLPYKGIDTEVYSNPSRDKKPKGWSRIYFAIPIRMRKKLHKLSPVIKRVFKKAVDSSGTPIGKLEIDRESMELLSRYYKNSNRQLAEATGMDISSWS